MNQRDPERILSQGPSLLHIRIGKQQKEGEERDESGSHSDENSAVEADYLRESRLT